MYFELLLRVRSLMYSYNIDNPLQSHWRTSIGFGRFQTVREFEANLQEFYEILYLLKENTFGCCNGRRHMTTET